MNALWLWLPPFLLSLIPGLFWLWFIHSQRPQAKWGESYPLSTTIFSFLGGGLSVLLVLAISMPLHRYLPAVKVLHSSSWGRFVYFILVVGLVEEFSKLVAVRILAYPFPRFREAWDGLMASSAAALGFATAENAKYIVESGTSSVLIGRSVSATIGHVLMSGLWGYALGQSKEPASARSGRRLLVLPSLMVSAIGHGAYDFLLIQDLGFLALAVLLLLWSIFWTQIRESRILTSKRALASSKVKECRECASLGRWNHSFCPNCAHSFPESVNICCSNCLSRLPDPQATRCPDCQSNLE